MMMLSVLFVFLQLCSLQMTVVSKPTCQVKKDLIERAHKHLMELVSPGEGFPVHCLPYNEYISFPSSVLSTPQASRSSRSLHCPQTLSLMNETLWGAWLLFKEPGVPLGEGGVTWNRSELGRFQEVWHRLLRQTSCLPSVGGSGVLTPYFSNVTAVMEQQESAACGWMALRRDLLRFLNSTLKSKSACFTGPSNDGRGPAHI